MVPGAAAAAWPLGARGCPTRAHAHGHAGGTVGAACVGAGELAVVVKMRNDFEKERRR